MRRFSSYDPINTDLDYYAPRTELIDKGYTQLIGRIPDENGNYFTVWAPRQCGKTWLLQQIVEKIRQTEQYHVAILTLELAKEEKNEDSIVSILLEKLQTAYSLKFPAIKKISEIPSLFTKTYFNKPVILVLDEFDALEEEWINRIVAVFRDMFTSRTNEPKKKSEDKPCLLHGLALIGVRSVLGIENEKGSPFNVQRSIHVPNLTLDEVKNMFQWYEKESNQSIKPEVIDRLYYETNGQPGLTCWFGELITETYNEQKNLPISMTNFNRAYSAATHILPNNNILNLISKVNKPPYNDIVMDFFKTGEKIEFKFTNKETNYLYMNGLITPEEAEDHLFYIKFSCPFVQKSIFDYFSSEIFGYLGQLIHPLDTMTDAINEENLYIPAIINRYRDYLKKNRETFFKNVPRRKTDLKIYEAIFHFNLYRYLVNLLNSRGVMVIPQFPTGNGKIDLILEYKDKKYALELKSFKDMYLFEKGIEQAADYGLKLGLSEIIYLVFIELTQEEAGQLEKEIDKPGIRVKVLPVGIL